MEKVTVKTVAEANKLIQQGYKIEYVTYWVNNPGTTSITMSKM